MYLNINKFIFNSFYIPDNQKHTLLELEVK
jgi:hypothetical protein